MSQAGNNDTSPDATNNSKRPSDRRLATLIAGAILLASGITAIAIPWVARSPRWDWNIQNTDDLRDAEVNADIERSNDPGVWLRRRGERHISIISRPLSGLRSGRPSVEVSVARPQDGHAAERSPSEIRVILFWQTATDGPFRMEEQRRSIAPGAEIQILFMPPVDVATIHRIGVQVPDVDQIKIGGIHMVDCSLHQRADLVRHELAAQETFGSESVNYYKGPNLLGHGLNYYLASLASVSLGIACVVAYAARRRMTLRSFVIAGAIPWFAGDLVFTPQLFDRAEEEVNAYRVLDERSSYAAAYDEATVAASDAIMKLPIGTRVAVLSENATTTGHRMAYLAAPHMVLVEKPEDADYFVMLGNCASADKLTVLRSDNNEPLPVGMIHRWSDGCLLRRADH